MQNNNFKMYFSLAKEQAKKSKDPNTKVGAIIVKDNKVIGKGFNSMPNDSKIFPWSNDLNLPVEETKYPYVVHAEMNAVINANNSIENCQIFTTLFPCSNCAKFLVQAKIKEVYYIDDKYKDTEDYKIAMKIFRTSNIIVKKITI